jgi:nitrile hydratase
MRAGPPAPIVVESHEFLAFRRCLMSKSQDSVGRRGFLQTAATSAAGIVAGAAPGFGQTRVDLNQQAVPSDLTLRVKALESLLVDKGLVDRVALDRIVDAFETKIGPRNGARVVARAWVDPAYKKKLLADASTAMEELGFHRYQGEDIVALENTPKIHNLVVCTLCSCYPWPLLGLPPVWYKSAPYRSRAVIDPRGVLKEFGLDIGADVEVRVWDSTAEIRYIVLPERPAGSERLSEDALAALVTRDSMIGTARVTLAVTERTA